MIHSFLIPLLIQTILIAYSPRLDALLDSGDFESAYHILLDEFDRQPGDEATLYLLGVTAPVGTRSSLYLKEYLQKYPDGPNATQVRRNLLDYYSAAGLKITAGKLFLDELAEDILSPDDLYNIAIVKQQLGEYDKARQLFQHIVAISEGEMAAWGYLALSDCDLLSGDYQAALNGYRTVIDRFSDSPPFPFALVGLSEAYRRMGELDKARSYYELYREKYEMAPGSLEIETAILDSDADVSRSDLPAILDVDYYVQVGIFAHKSNAKTCVRRFRNVGYRSRMQDFRDGSKTFYRVIVGPYESEKIAYRKKLELEESQGEEYLIVLQ
jgi:tetratricopeptide (TPR) repeat protein